jgi:two-component system chemotaxis response regulator CheV
MPEAPPCVEGVIELRGRVMPLVNLGTRLAAENFDEKEKHIIICEFNQTFVAFLVNQVSRIHRISWNSLEPAPLATNTEIVTGIVKMSDKLIILLDFERILTEISPEMNKKLHYVPGKSATESQQRGEKTILIAEDSKMLRELMVGTLREAGYTKLLVHYDGQTAWNELEEIAGRPEPVEQHIQLVITDIEMPQMDGHHLTKKIKGHQKLCILPVIIFSSLISDEMRRKGEGLGAAAQISKPEVEMMINAVDNLVL